MGGRESDPVHREVSMRWLLPVVLVITFSLPLVANAQDLIVVPLDTLGNVGNDCRLRIDSNNIPHIIYQDYTNDRYKHAYLQDMIWHIENLQYYQNYNGFHDYELDAYGNIHGVRAGETRLFYYLVSSEGSMTTVVDSIPWFLRYSDAEIELVAGLPRIVCVQYMTPAYLIEANFTGYEWIIDTVCWLPDGPTGIEFRVFSDTNHVSFSGSTGPLITGLFYRRWVGAWATEETIWPDSVNGIKSMDLDSDGRPWIAFSYDNGNDNYHGVVAYKTGQNWQWDYIDTAYSAPQQIIYSRLEQKAFLLLARDTPQSDPNPLFLAGKTSSGWEFEQLYSARRISGGSGALDSFGNLHFCFSVSQYSDRDLYYGFRRSTVGVDDINPPDYINLGLSAYPNPFNSSTTISFELAQPSYVTLAVYNLLGQKVVTLFEGVKGAGSHRVIWEAVGMPSGTYLARLTAESGETRETRMVLVK